MSLNNKSINQPDKALPLLVLYWKYRTQRVVSQPLFSFCVSHKARMAVLYLVHYTFILNLTTSYIKHISFTTHYFYYFGKVDCTIKFFFESNDISNEHPSGSPTI